MSALSPAEIKAAALRSVERYELALLVGDGNLHRGLSRLLIAERRAEAKGNFCCPKATLKREKKTPSKICPLNSAIFPSREQNGGGGLSLPSKPSLTP